MCRLQFCLRRASSARIESGLTKRPIATVVIGPEQPIKIQKTPGECLAQNHVYNIPNITIQMNKNSKHARPCLSLNPKLIHTIVSTILPLPAPEYKSQPLPVLSLCPSHFFTFLLPPLYSTPPNHLRVLADPFFSHKLQLSTTLSTTEVNSKPLLFIMSNTRRVSRCMP